VAGDRDTQNPGRVPQPVGFSPLREADLPRILEIERVCFSQPWSEDSFREVVAGRTFPSLAARTASGELMGYIVFSEAADELHILNVAVHPSHRKHGVASAMLTYLHNYAAERGREFSYLEVRESNRPAQELYAKFGYKILTKRKMYYVDDRENAIVMVAELKPRKKGWRR
jgi:[ribosomal protein S18]-alanine N-acetyltransferase